MVRRLLAVFLLVNVVGVVVNLPRILEAMDGEGLGHALSEWVVGVGTAAGDLIGEMGESTLTPDEIAALQEELRSGSLEDPLDDVSVRALVDLWVTLRDAGAQLQADELRDLLLDEGIDPADEASDLPQVPHGDGTTGPLGIGSGAVEVDAGQGLGGLGR